MEVETKRLPLISIPADGKTLKTTPLEREVLPRKITTLGDPTETSRRKKE